jgi:geranylgeranyl pyrophosphate synthase
MDDAATRRGVETTHARFAARAPTERDAARHGVAVAILVGDLAAVLAEQLLRTSGAAPERLAVAASRFDRMRVEMAAGQYLDLAARDRTPRNRLATLKTGSYTVEGPLLVGSALAGAGSRARCACSAGISARRSSSGTTSRTVMRRRRRQVVSTSSSIARSPRSRTRRSNPGPRGR